MASLGRRAEAHLTVLDLGVPERKARDYWPNLRDGEFERTSPSDSYYNCIAWAMNDRRRWWEPSGNPEHYWPARAPRDYSREAFMAAFKTRHFVPCDDGTLEPGWEKIAIYWREGADPEAGFQHVARQLPDGRWSSKLGKARDIAHVSIDALSGDFYGEVAFYMRRPRSAARGRPPTPEQH